jgi:hypothetical protein
LKVCFPRGKKRLQKGENSRGPIFPLWLNFSTELARKVCHDLATLVTVRQEFIMPWQEKDR